MTGIVALIRELSSPDYNVRRNAAAALVKIGDSRAVNPLCVALLKDKAFTVRWYAAEALGKIGDARAVDALCTALKDEDGNVRREAAEAIFKIGRASEYLPRRVIADKSLTLQRRAEVLDALYSLPRPYAVVRGGSPNTRTFCQEMLNDADEAVREGTQAVLDWLYEHSTLMRPGQRDVAREPEELLRPAAYTETDAENTRMRPMDTPQRSSEALEARSEEKRHDLLTGEPIIYLAIENARVRKPVYSLLEDRDYSVIVFKDERTIYEAVQSRLPHLLICDQYSVDENGKHLIEKLFAEPVYRQIPVIMLMELSYAYPQWWMDLYAKYSREMILCAITIPFSPAELKHDISRIEDFIKQRS